MKRVTIHSDGFGGTGTIIVDDEGNKLEGVVGAAIFLSAGDVNTVTIDLAAVPVTVSGVVSGINATCPCCKLVLEHKCETVLGPQPEPDEDGVITFKIMEATASSGNGLMAGNGLSFQFGQLKLKPVPPT